MTDSFASCFYDFFTSIEQKKQPETSGDEGLRDLATAFAVLESSASGRAVSVEDVLTGKVREAQRAIDTHYGLV